jgi:hypothetical protein
MNPIYKFNNGRGAMLCNGCRTIISTGPKTEELFCDKCKNMKYTRTTTNDIIVNGHEILSPPTDSVVEAVRDDLLRRSKIGIKKYNTTLDRTDIDLKGWVTHALEEVLDLSLYLKRIQIELNERT